MEKGKEDCQWISWLTQVRWTGLHWLMPGCPPQGAGQCPPAGMWKKSTWQPQSRCPFSSVLKLQAHVANVGPRFACRSQQYGLLIYLLWTSSALEPLSRSFSPQPYALSYHLILSNSSLFLHFALFLWTISIHYASLKSFSRAFSFGCGEVFFESPSSWEALSGGLAAFAFLSTLIMFGCTWFSLPGALLNSQTHDQLIVKRIQNYLDPLNCFFF